MIVLPRLEAPELAAATAIFRRRPPLAFATAAGMLSARPLPPVGMVAAPFRLDLRLGEGRGVLLAEGGLAEALLFPALGGLDLELLDAETRGLVQELVLTPLATAVETALGRPVRLSPDALSAGLPHALGFEVELGGGGPAYQVRLELDLRGLEAVVRAFERVPALPAALPGLILPLAVEVGRTRLPLAELQQAGEGDLLLLEETGTLRGRLDLVLGGVLAFGCTLSGTALSYLGEVRSRVAEQPNAAVERLDEVPVELVFELGRLSLPLGELRTLAPGHVFDLGRDLRHPVDVLLAGRKVGEGELVQVGERVGVRLRSIVPR